MAKKVPLRNIDRRKLKSKLRHGDLKRIEANLKGRYSYDYISQVMRNERYNAEIVRAALALANNQQTVTLPENQAAELAIQAA